MIRVKREPLDLLIAKREIVSKSGNLEILPR